MLRQRDTHTSTLDDSEPGSRPSEVRERALAKRRPEIGVWLHRYALVGAWIIVVAIFGIAEPSTFLTGADFSAIFSSQAVLLVLTLGLLIPAIAGDYDLSIAFTLNLSAMIVAILNVNYHWPIGLAVLVALSVGACIGAINGAIVTYFGLSPFIITLGTGTFIGGVTLWISNSNTITGVSQSLVNATFATHVFGISLSFYYAIGLGLIMWYVFDLTSLGRRLLIVGTGRKVARLSGLRVSRIRFGALVASGVVSALAGVIYAGTQGGADPSSGSQLLLPAFAAAFLGATAIQPGRFNPPGAIVAVYFLVTGITGLQLLGVQTFVQSLFYGGAFVVAVVLSRIGSRRSGQAADEDA